MEARIEEISQSKRRIHVEIDKEEVNKKIEQTYRELSKRSKIKGFRPGKAPRKILEQYYGKQIISDVKGDLIKESFPNVLEKTKLYPLGQPSIEDETIEEKKNFKYTIYLEVKPDFEIKDYMGISVEKEMLNISEDTVNKALKEITEAHAKLISIDEDRPLASGDYGVIDYDAFIGNSPVKGVKGRDIVVHTGGGTIYPEIESGIIGLSKGDKKDIEIDFKKDFPDKRLAGRLIRFEVKIQDIKIKKIPQLNDDFIKELEGDFKSLEDLRLRVKEEITLQEEKRIDDELKKRLLKEIARKVDFELPQVLVDNTIENSIATIKQSVTRSGAAMESTGISEQQMRKDLIKPSEEKVKEGLILDAIARLENIKVEDSDIRKEFEKIADKIGKDVTFIKQYYEKNNLMNSLAEQILTEKTLNHLVQGAIIKEVEGISEKVKKMERN